MINTTQKNQAYNIDAEIELLGLLIQNNSQFAKIKGFFKKEYFYVAIHASIFETICKIISINDIKTDQRGNVATSDTIYHAMVDNEEFKKYAGKEYLLKIERTFGIGTIISRATLIKSLYYKRLSVENIEKRLENMKNSSFINVYDNIMQEKRELDSIVHQITPDGHDICSLPDITEEFESVLLGKQEGITTGYTDLDRLIHGFKSGQLITIGARSSMGKTAFGINLAKNIANNDYTVGYFTLEMKASEISKRIISLESDVELNAVKTGFYFNKDRITKIDTEKVRASSKKVSSLPIKIVDASGVNIEYVKQRCIAMKKMHNIDIIIIDYLGLIKITGNNGFNLSYKIGEIANDLKSLAKELEIPIVILSQLNRELEKRESQRPRLSDLKESGGVEEASDIVLLLYKESYYLERNKPDFPKEVFRDVNEPILLFNKRQADYQEAMNKYNEWQNKYNDIKNKFEIIIAKNRDGQIGSIELFADLSKMKISNIEEKVNFDSIKYVNRIDIYDNTVL